MKRLRLWVIGTLVFGILSLLAVGISSLALVDIYHAREPDLTQEWRMVQMAVLPILIFHVLAMATLFATFRVTGSTSA
jgi:hypothetical protein